MDTNLHHLQFPNQMYCWSRQLQFPRHILTSFQLSFDHENISNFGLGSNMLVGCRQKCKEICDTWNSPREHKSDKSMYMLFDIRCMQALTGVGQSQSNPGNNKCISGSLRRCFSVSNTRPVLNKHPGRNFQRSNKRPALNTDPSRKISKIFLVLTIHFA